MFGRIGTLCVALFVASITPDLRADIITYTFDAPQFTVGQATPLFNRAPNSGPNTFLANFQTTAGSMSVTTNPLNVLMSGPILQDLTFVPKSLNISFNVPVFKVSADFAVFGSGQLALSTAVGCMVQPSAVVGGMFQGGTIAFSSFSSFTSLQLTGVNTVFAIDNLTFNTQPIPEPSTVLTFATGLMLM